MPFFSWSQIILYCCDTLNQCIWGKLANTYFPPFWMILYITGIKYGISPFYLDYLVSMYVLVCRYAADFMLKIVKFIIIIRIFSWIKNTDNQLLIKYVNYAVVCRYLLKKMKNIFSIQNRVRLPYRKALYKRKLISIKKWLQSTDPKVWFPLHQSKNI